MSTEGEGRRRGRGASSVVALGRELAPRRNGVGTAHELLEKQYGGVVFVWEIYIEGGNRCKIKNL